MIILLARHHWDPNCFHARYSRSSSF